MIHAVYSALAVFVFFFSSCTAVVTSLLLGTCVGFDPLNLEKFGNMMIPHFSALTSLSVL